ncbi:MAG: ABC transporter permease [Bryobacteraceae bacterium]|nr:ABC transporter permease [Bryobacteraceae bacterium]
MNFADVRTLFRKELLDLMRDRRTLISLVVAPMLIGPVIMTLMNYYVNRSAEQAKVERYKIALREEIPVVGLRQALTSAGLEVVPSDAPRQAVETKAVTFGIDIAKGTEKPQLRFYSDNSEMKTNMARARVNDAIERVWREAIRVELAKRNVPESAIEPFSRQSVNTAQPRKMTGAFIGRLMGFLLLIFIFNGAMYSAVDTTAGEKERKTMEMLLSSAAGRTEIVTAKVLLALVTSLGTTVLSISSYALAFANSTTKGGSPVTMPVDPGTLMLILLLIVPIAVMAASVSVAAATPARSTREAMSYLTPGIFIVMFLGMVPFILEGSANPVIYIIPFANFAQMLREVIAGEWSWSNYAIVFASNLAYSAIAIGFAVRSFRNESILFRA